MEAYLPISFLNDFVFCPRSIYYHQLYSNFDKIVYQGAPQAKGTEAHKSIDTQTYSNDTAWLVGIDIYSDRYGICGKIDQYNSKTQVLRERKRKIKTIYDGYIFQVYAQYFCLTEMGYPVKKIEIYDITQNKNHSIKLPREDDDMFRKFETLLINIKNFKLEDEFMPNISKCENCIYSSLCDKSLC